jgi:hypothetical protein
VAEVVTRSAEWSTRIHFPALAKVPPGFGSEYWDLDPTHHEGWEALRDRYISVGRKWTKRGLALELAWNLLDDVIDAAGGVEYSMARLRSTVTEVEHWIRQSNVRAQPGVPMGVANEYTWKPGTPSAMCSHGAVRWRSGLSDGHAVGSFRNQGLVPALKPKRLKNRAEKLHDQLRAGSVGETRLLTNFSLHAGPSPKSLLGYESRYLGCGETPDSGSTEVTSCPLAAIRVDSGARRRGGG